jgi:asparagine synthase (glutamine-hydrolysing)
MHDRGHDPTFHTVQSGRDAQWALLLPGADYAGALRAQVGAAFGFEARDPTRDIRLIEFALGLPGHIWRGPQPRWLIRRAVRGVVPDSIRLGRLRGLQAADLASRLMADMPAIDRVLPAVLSHETASGLLDGVRLLSFAERLRRRQAVPLMDCHMFLRALSVGCFVVRFENSHLGYTKSHETA